MKSYKMKKQETNLSKSIKKTLVNYAKTQFLIVIVVTSISWIILSLLGFRHAILLAGITGSLSTIPFIGMTIAAVIVGLTAIFDGLNFLNGFHPIFEGMMMLIIYFVLNQLTDFLLAPYLMGKMTKVHPFLIILFVIVGTWIFGIFGAILAIPVLLVIKTILGNRPFNEA